MDAVPKPLTLTRVRLGLLQEAGIDRAAREDLVFIDNQRAEWYVIDGGTRVFAVGGLLGLGTRRSLLRGLWVPPDLRGRGLGRRMAEGLIGIARERGARLIEARTIEWEFFERLGFTWTGDSSKWRGPRPSRVYHKEV